MLYATDLFRPHPISIPYTLFIFSLAQQHHFFFFFFFSSRRRHTRLQGDWSSDVCSSDLANPAVSTVGAMVSRSMEFHSGLASEITRCACSPRSGVSIDRIHLPISSSDRKSVV